MNHLQVFDKTNGDVIAKAEFSDNYVSLQGHSVKTVEITIPAKVAAKSGNFALRLDGWNINHDEIEFANGAFEISLNADAENYNPATATFNTCTR